MTIKQRHGENVLAVWVSGESVPGIKNVWCQYAQVGVSRVRGERLGKEKGWGGSHWPTDVVRTLAFTPSEEQTMEGFHSEE